jgi:hypothetical protein
LTPAEELGLSGLVMAARVRKAFASIDEPALRRLIDRLDAEALRRHLFYIRDGLEESIRILPCPLTVLPDQLAYVHTASLTILNALKRLPQLYVDDPDVRETLRLAPEEEAWFRACWDAGPRESDPVFGRLDAVVDFTSPMWKNALHFLEPNLGGVGGIHLLPTAENIVADVVVPALRAADHGLDLRTGHDIRELLMQMMLDHLEAIGRPARNIAFIEPIHASSGPDDQEALARYYRDRYALKTLHADPADLRLDGDEVWFGDSRIDLAYRDYEVRDLIGLRGQGVDIEPVRALMLQNRMVSSITAEFDQKSCWEVLTDPALAQRHFHTSERQVFRRHVLWTRLLADRRTSLPDGDVDDLLGFVRRERELLVLKPNRGYGGAGVALGGILSQTEWENAIDTALADSERWVVQRLANIPVAEFPVLAPDRATHIEPFYIVMGFAATEYGLSVLVRASQKQVVNVAQRGGLCALLSVRPPERPFGNESVL